MQENFKEEKTMTINEIRDYYTQEIEFLKKQIEWSTREINWLTKQMKRESKEMDRLAEFVWSQGVLTRLEMEVWGTDKPKSADWKKYNSERCREYRRRKKYAERVEKYEALLREI